MKNQTPNDGESNRTKPDAVDGPKSAATRATNILNILALALVIHFHRGASFTIRKNTRASGGSYSFALTRAIAVGRFRLGRSICAALRELKLGWNGGYLDKTPEIACNVCRDRNNRHTGSASRRGAEICIGVGKSRRALGRQSLGESDPCIALCVEAPPGG